MEKSTTIVNEGLNLGQELNAALRKDFERGHRGLQVRAGNRGRHQRAVARLVADRARHHAAERNHARDQLGGGRAGFRSAGGGAGHGTHARTGAASNTSGSTELAASSDQMSKMSRGLLDSMDRFALLGPANAAGRTTAHRDRHAARARRRDRVEEDSSHEPGNTHCGLSRGARDLRRAHHLAA
jgi:hypothetical protein